MNIYARKLFSAPARGAQGSAGDGDRKAWEKRLEYAKLPAGQKVFMGEKQRILKIFAGFESKSGKSIDYVHEICIIKE